MKRGIVRGLILGLGGGLTIQAASAEGRFSAQIGTSTDAYVSSGAKYFRDGASSELYQLNMALKGEAESKSFKAKLDFENRYSLSEQANYVHPNDAYLMLKGRVLSVSLGRKRMTWSEVDDGFRLGLYASRYMEDKTVAESSALTGLYIESAPGPFRFTVFASPLFIPENGPKTSIADGKFVSRNPWFKQPTPSVRLMDQTGTTDVNYSIVQPNIGSTIWQPSLVTSAGWEKHGHFLRFTYADKPMNQMLLSFPLVLNTLPTNIVLDVAIRPRTIRHRLYNGEIGTHQEGGVHAVMGVIHEEPLRDLAMDTWITQTVGPASVYYSTLGYDLKRSGPQATYLGLSYLRVEGGDSADRGEFAQPVSFFERRYQYTRSVKLEFRTPLWRRGMTAVRSQSWSLYDFDQRAMIWSSALEYLERDFLAYLKVELMGIVDEAQAVVTDGFIRNFRANDRVTMGLAYAF